MKPAAKGIYMMKKIQITLIGLSILEFILIGFMCYTNFLILLNTDKDAPVTIDSSLLLERIQEWRTSENLPVYNQDYFLCGVADERVKQIQYDFSHEQFRVNSDSWIKEGHFTGIGSNLLRGATSVSNALDMWLNSPSHREQLEFPFTKTCVRCDGGYCVQIFAK